MIEGGKEEVMGGERGNEKMKEKEREKERRLPHIYLAQMFM